MPRADNMPTVDFVSQVTEVRHVFRAEYAENPRAILKTVGPGSGWFITAAKPRPMLVRLAMAA